MNAVRAENMCESGHTHTKKMLYTFTTPRIHNEQEFIYIHRF